MSSRAMFKEVTPELRAFFQELLGPDAPADDEQLVAALRTRLAAEYESGFRDGFRERGKGGKLNDRGVPREFRVITARRRKKWRRLIVRLGVGAVLLICALLIYVAST